MSVHRARPLGSTRPDGIHMCRRTRHDTHLIAQAHMGHVRVHKRVQYVTPASLCIENGCRSGSESERAAADEKHISGYLGFFWGFFSAAASILENHSELMEISRRTQKRFWAVIATRPRPALLRMFALGYFLVPGVGRRQQFEPRSAAPAPPAPIPRLRSQIQKLCA